jgi:hypothetical protein
MSRGLIICVIFSMRCRKPQVYSLLISNEMAIAAFETQPTLAYPPWTMLNANQIISFELKMRPRRGQNQGFRNSHFSVIEQPPARVHDCVDIIPIIPACHPPFILYLLPYAVLSSPSLYLLCPSLDDTTAISCFRNEEGWCRGDNKLFLEAGLEIER